jgi:tetratricopeptide (TPR) repeat protein
MKKLPSYISLFLLALGGLMLLCTVFASDSSLANGMVMGKVCWFHLAMGVFALGILSTAATSPPAPLPRRGEEEKSLLISPLLVAGVIALVLLTYDFDLNPEPEKLLFFGQLVLLWFMLRVALRRFPALRGLFLFFILCTSLVEAVWGLEQLYGYKRSAHALFRLTGSFYNPGPYGGYLAVALPMALSLVLRKDSRPTFLYHFGWLCLGLLLVVLPASMSRSAWIAAAVSCVWVYGLQRIGWDRLKAFGRRHRKRSIALLSGGLIACTLALGAIYQLKKDSADGRLLMWKISAATIAAHPLGVGLGGFPAAYAASQATYLASPQASHSEKIVAGAPEYAFNEYLQIGVEQGIAGMLLFLFCIGYSLYAGIRNGQIMATGGLLSLALFAFSSYPLQLPEFWVLLVFLNSSITTPTTSPPAPLPRRGGIRRFLSSSPLPGRGVGGEVFLVLLLLFLQKDSYGAYREWSRAKMYYTTRSYEVGAKAYAPLYIHLKHKPEYLFEYAQCLNKTERYAEAKGLLERAARLSADPMIHYMIAKNQQALGEYAEAEKRLLRAIDILPERLYPWYLLAKLYAEPDFYQAEKLRTAIDSVLTKEPKVETTAIREMREEVRKIIK